MSKTIKEQFVEALEHGITHKAICLVKLMEDEINELYDYRSPLVWAKRYGNEKLVQDLREMGAVEVVDKEGMIDELIKILDADKIDEIDEKRAIELIKGGANIEKKYKFGETALMKASQRGHVEIVKALLDAGAKVDEKDGDGNTALMMASWYGRLDAVKTLISMGAKVDEKDNDGKTALILVSGNGEVEVVKALLDAGAKVDEKDNDGYTALMYASSHGNVEVVKALLDAGADVTIIDDDGRTAIDCAYNDEIKKMLHDALRKQKEKKSEQTVKSRGENSFGE